MTPDPGLWDRSAPARVPQRPVSPPTSVLFLHPALGFSSGTERLLRGVEHLLEHDARVTVLARAGARADELRATGADVVMAEATVSGWRGLFAAARARRLAAQVGAEIVHVTSEALAPLAARLGRPYLLEIERPVRARLTFHSEHLARVVLPCRTLEESAVNRGGLPRDRFAVLPHAPRIPAGVMPDPFGREELPRVGCAGYLTPDFGADVFLEAARRLVVRGLRARFLVLGEGPDEVALRRRARELAIEEHVTITAPAAPRTAEVLAQLDLFACPRLDGAPGWFAHEALALGLPCVVSAIGGAFTLVEDGRDALLVERGDPGKLAGALGALLEDPGRARRLGLAARERSAARAAEGPAFGEALTALLAQAAPGLAVG